MRDEDVERGRAAVGVVWRVLRSPTHYSLVNWGTLIVRVGLAGVRGDNGAGTWTVIRSFGADAMYVWTWEYVVVAQEGVGVSIGQHCL